MSESIKKNVLVNLPPSFFTQPQLKKQFARIGKLGAVRKRSYNAPDEISGDLKWADAAVMWSWPVFSKDFLQQAGGLEFLGQINTSATTARACLELGIAHSEARHCWSPAVAEMALTLILAGLRNTSTFHMQMRTGKESWINDFPADIDPMERQLSGRTVGIVGFGAIGQRLAQLLAPFNVNLMVHDPFLPAAVAQKYNATMVKVPQLAKNAEVIVLCAANTDNARHVFGAKEIASLRKGAVLVNVGRSLLVDMDALTGRLEQGDIIAMLDVFEKEPLEKNSKLRKLPNAFLTPHRAGGILESVERALDMLITDLESHLSGKPIRYRVTEAMLPCFTD